MKRTIGIGIAVLLVLAFAHAGWADDEGEFRYVVKFACGFNDTISSPGPAFGHYSTIVNVHNPSKHSVRFKKKVAVAFVNGALADSVSPGAVSDFDHETLAGDQADGIDCFTIKRILGVSGVEGFLDGFLVIITRKELDVTALYTAEQCRALSVPAACTALGVKAGVTTMAVQVIAPRKDSD